MSGKIKKTYLLSASAYEVIKQVKEKWEFRSDITALEYILVDYAKKENETEVILDALDERYKAYMNRLMWLMQEAEENGEIILDILNTFLHVYDPQDKGMYECMKAGDMPHPFIEQSKDALKERMVRAKQIKDNRSRKNKE